MFLNPLLGKFAASQTIFAASQTIFAASQTIFAASQTIFAASQMKRTPQRDDKIDGV